MKVNSLGPAKKHWQLITRIERRIEDTMVEEPAVGFIENMFGSFDRADLTAKLLAAYEQLEKHAPYDLDVRYRYAGALMRASRYEDARRLYLDTIKPFSSALLMLAMLELKWGDRAAAEAFMDAYNTRCIAEGCAVLQSEMAKIVLPPPRT